MNVLICDDDASTRFMLKRILAQNLGWNVSESGDGVDALAQLSRRRFDLLLLDLEIRASTSGTSTSSRCPGSIPGST